MVRPTVQRQAASQCSGSARAGRRCARWVAGWQGRLRAGVVGQPAAGAAHRLPPGVARVSGWAAGQRKKPSMCGAAAVVLVDEASKAASPPLNLQQYSTVVQPPTCRSPFSIAQVPPCRQISATPCRATRTRRPRCAASWRGCPPPSRPSCPRACGTRRCRGRARWPGARAAGSSRVCPGQPFCLRMSRTRQLPSHRNTAPQLPPALQEPTDRVGRRPPLGGEHAEGRASAAAPNQPRRPALYQPAGRVAVRCAGRIWGCGVDRRRLAEGGGRPGVG